MSKKNDEKEILFSVYTKESIAAALIEDETPDFILIDKSNNKKVGVEITTLFTNQASAISKNDKFLDSYIDRHIAQSKKPNKKKKGPKYLQNLNVTPIEGDDSLVHKDHIVWQTVGLKDYFSFFEDIIKDKSKAYVKKVKGLQFVNLIGKDVENFFKSKGRVIDLYGLLRQHSIFQAIINSNFQEIFFLACFIEGKYSIPLKWLIFRTEYELFKLFWQETKIKNLKSLLDNFCICMVHLGYKNIYLSSSEAYRYIIFGTSCWKINKTTDEINEYHFLALELPEETLAQNTFKNYNDYSTIFLKYMEFRQSRNGALNEGLFRRIDE